MHIALLIFAALLAVACFMPLIRYDAWWVRSFDFPRGQFFILGLLTLTAILALWGIDGWTDGIVLAVLATGLVLQAYSIWPYTALSPKQVATATGDQPDASVSVLVANVLMSNRDAGRLLDLVEQWDPDIVLALEPDAWWAGQMAVLEEGRPHTIKEPLDNRYGMLLYSRLPLEAPEIKYLLNDEIPSFHTRLRLPSGRLVWLHALHPEPPSPTEADESTERDAELLIVGREVEKRDEPTIVAGDMNDVAWSYTTTLFQRISGLLDPRRGRGMFNTYHAGNPLMRWPLDHVFHSDHFMLDRMARLPAFGSDHFPVYVRLVMQDGAEAIQDEPEADEDDREEAAEKIGAVTQKEAL